MREKGRKRKKLRQNKKEKGKKRKREIREIVKNSISNQGFSSRYDFQLVKSASSSYGGVSNFDNRFRQDGFGP